MFVDKVQIELKSGSGGNGAVAFRREKFVPNGGPAGGDGGSGGNIIFKVDSNLRTLMDFRYHHKFNAKDGGNGSNKQMTGKSAEDLILKVPSGTIVKKVDSDEIWVDLTDDGQEFTLARGGRGGRGNMHFVKPNRQAPEIAENGEPGEELKVILELKMLADVGLIGLPSAGKSTLLSVLTSAKPKIASYHFTTLEPNLGMVKQDDGSDFVIADIPGLIQGASKGVGLGFEFLRHIERTKVLIHLVAMDGETELSPFENFEQINEELQKYNENLLDLPQIIVASKMDLNDAQEYMEQFKSDLKASKKYDNVHIYGISAITHQGLDGLLHEIVDQLKTVDNQIKMIDNNDSDQVVEYVFEPEEEDFEVAFKGDRWYLTGNRVEKLFKMTNFDHDDSILRFAVQLRRMGVDEQLQKLGAKQGDLVQIQDFVFEFVS